MIRLHCTKDLLKRLPLQANGRIRTPRHSRVAANDDDLETRLSGWHAKRLLIQRRQCLLFVHDATRFPVFVPAVLKAVFAALDYHFSTSFMNTLLKTGADNELMDRAQAALAPLVCDSVCDRSVQGTMNQMGQDLDYLFDDDRTPVNELTGYRQGAWLADRPCMVKGGKECLWPKQAMRDFLLDQGH
ncbi:DUF6933 domain-containing protein [Wenzhouxiangella marina]|uniref:DUF6933 domain-containing protein n=1 Tax=Wenzhouxiangella marina TaxID=1579979 RepID=A0A0K0XZW6_9GAMM|nr:hypothetical protein [Wenzhouxiangella marina]AKS43219.1 hypothetical protein WM2015_2862 [Wenzhouxiangella marina]MBB6087094.1 hypothetical protein [Wenzhouxiangella marina]